MQFKTKLNEIWVCCTECEEEVNSVVHVGYIGTPGWDLCMTCLAKATHGVYLGLCEVHKHESK